MENSLVLGSDVQRPAGPRQSTLMCRLTTCHYSLVIGSDVRRPASPGRTNLCAGLPNVTIHWSLEAKSRDQQRKAEHKNVQAYQMSQFIGPGKRCPETSEPRQNTLMCRPSAPPHHDSQTRPPARWRWASVQLCTRSSRISNGLN